MVLSLIFLSWVAAAEPTQPLENGYRRAATDDPKFVDVSVIDESRAKELFAKFSKDEKIPFRYPIDGCYARATYMAKKAEEEDHLIAGKIFVSGKLYVSVKGALYDDVYWGWHVAPVFYVKRPDGQTKLMVFDPSLFTRPVTVEEFKARLVTHSKNPKWIPDIEEVYFANRFQYGPRKEESYKSNWNFSDMLGPDGVDRTFSNYAILQEASLKQQDPDDPSRFFGSEGMR